MVRVSVSVDDEHLAKIGSVADQLSSQGLRVGQVLEGLGIITGEVDEGGQESLRGVAGVTSVDRQQDVRIAPPDSPVQ